MKKYSILIAVLVLTAAFLTGCRRPGATPTELPPHSGSYADAHHGARNCPDHHAHHPAFH